MLRRSGVSGSICTLSKTLAEQSLDATRETKSFYGSAGDGLSSRSALTMLTEKVKEKQSAQSDADLGDSTIKKKKKKKKKELGHF